MKVYSTKPLIDEWSHKIEGITLHIEKDGVSMSFNDDEVMEILAAVGMASRDFRNGYKL